MEDRYISFRGLMLHYQLMRPRGAVRHRALLIPAPGESCLNWRPLLPELMRAGCLCVIVDLPGFGKSMCGEGVPHRQDTRAQLLWGILDQVDGEFTGQVCRWNLIGHGSGAGTAMMMALLQPDSCASLTLITPILRAVVPAFLRPLVRSRLGERMLRGLYGRYIYNRPRFHKLMRSLYGCELPMGYLDNIQAPLRRHGSDQALGRLLLNGYPLPERAFSIWAPVMVLWSEGDRMLGCAPPKWMRRALPQAEFHTLRFAGHYPVETDAGAVRDYLRGWIRDMWA